MILKSNTLKPQYEGLVDRDGNVVERYSPTFKPEGMEERIEEKMNFILIQVIGAIAFITLAVSYYQKEKKKILFMQIIAYIMFSIHYYLLSGITGAICNIIGLLALLSIYIIEKNKLKNKNKIISSSICIAMIFIVNIITFQNVFSFFPMIASTIVILSFILDNEDYIRGIGVVSAVCWLIYAIAYKSYISIVFEVFTLAGTLIAFIKNTSNPDFKIKGK